jgi:hypothetical protein
MNEMDYDILKRKMNIINLQIIYNKINNKQNMNITLYKEVIDWIPEGHEIVVNYIDMSYLQEIKRNETLLKRKDVFFTVLRDDPERWIRKSDNAVVYLVQNKEFSKEIFDKFFCLWLG